MVSSNGKIWVRVYDRIRFGDKSYDFPKGRRAFISALKCHFPDEERAIEQYMDLVKQAAKASQMYFAEKALPPVMARVAGKRMRHKFLQFARQTTLSVLEELTNNKELIGVLTSQYGDYGLPPGQSSFAMHAILVNHYLYGAAFPVGGSSRIAETISAVIAKSDGYILTNAEVLRIVVEKKTAIAVQLADGTSFSAPLIISSAGIFNTYQRLLPEREQIDFQSGQANGNN